MNPCDINTLVTAITNYLYVTLDPKDFTCLNIFISELSKSMFSMTLFRDICDKQGRPHQFPPPPKDKRAHVEHKANNVKAGDEKPQHKK